MIQIEIPGKGFLQLPEKASLSLKLNNPIFADNDFIPGDYSFPFDIDAGDSNGHNARLLNHPDIPENAAGTYEINGVRMLIDGLYYRTGTLVVSKATRDKVSINFRFGLRNIRSDFGSYKIRDLVDENIEITSETYHKKVVVDYGSTTPSPYKLKVNDTVFEAASMSALATAINADDRFTAAFLNTGDTWGITGDRITVEPTLGATEISTEFTVEFEPDADRWQWHITVNPEDDFYFWYAQFLDDQYAEANPYLFWPFMYAAGYLPAFSELNKVNADGYIFPFDRVQIGSMYVPYVSLKYVIDKIAEEFGVIFEGTFFETSWYPKSLFWNTKKMGEMQKYGYERDYLFLYNSFNVRDLLPDMTVDELLKGLQKKWNLDIIFNQDGNRIQINSRKAIVTANQYIDWTAIASPSETMDFSEFVQGYKLINPRQSDDFNDTDDSYTVGIPTEEIQGIFGSIKADIGNDLIGPYTGQAAGSDFIPRLFFYVGEVVSGYGITYHKASYKNPEVNYGGATGLGETEWKDWLNLLKGRISSTFNLMLDYRHIANIDYERKVMIDGTAYLIKSIDVKITSSGFEPAKAVLYRV